MRTALHALRREVEVLHREQEAAMTVLTSRTNRDALAERVHSRGVPSAGGDGR